MFASRFTVLVAGLTLAAGTLSSARANTQVASLPSQRIGHITTEPTVSAGPTTVVRRQIAPSQDGINSQVQLAGYWILESQPVFDCFGNLIGYRWVRVYVPC